MHQVKRGEFVHEVTERGNVESASNVEITCKVKSGFGGGSSRGSSGGTTILSIVPEGTTIKPEDCLPEKCVVTLEDIEALEKLKRGEPLDSPPLLPGGTEIEPEDDPPQGTETKLEDAEPQGTALEPRPGQLLGDEPEEVRISPEELMTKMILVRLESSSLDNQKIQQEIVVYNSEAAVIQGQNVLDAAVIALKEYCEGQYILDTREINSEILLAEENFRRAKEYYEYSRGMLAKGYVTEPQLEADKFACDKAENDLASAKKKLEILQEFTKEKMEKEIEASIKTAKAKLAATQASYDLDVEQLEEIEEQIANCTIFATKPGQVVYANREGHRGSDEVVIEEGTLVRERQAIIRLPDPKRMQVKAKVNEGMVKLVKKGMSTAIRLDAVPDTELQGVVKEVKEYPAPTWWGASMKEYETIIRILNPEEIDLRPGYTAEVKIRVEQLEDVLQVPVQAIVEHGAKHYCVLWDEKGFRTREVTIGSTNDKTVVIESGLEEGEEVVLNANAHREEAGLPELSPEAEAQQQQRQPDDRPEQQPAEGGKGPSEGRKGPPNIGQMLQGLDKNGDGQLDKDELDQLPEQFRSRLSAADKNGDGIIDRGELTAAKAQFGSGGPPGGPGAGGPPGGKKSGGRPGGRSPGTTP